MRPAPLPKAICTRRRFLGCSELPRRSALGQERARHWMGLQRSDLLASRPLRITTPLPILDSIAASGAISTSKRIAEDVRAWRTWDRAQESRRICGPAGIFDYPISPKWDLEPMRVLRESGPSHLRRNPEQILPFRYEMPFHRGIQMTKPEMLACSIPFDSQRECNRKPSSISQGAKSAVQTLCKHHLVLKKSSEGNLMKICLLRRFPQRSTAERVLRSILRVSCSATPMSSLTDSCRRADRLRLCDR